MIFTANDHVLLSDVVFRDDYPGYTPNIIESPNGDGKFDNQKRYAHIKAEYLNEIPWNYKAKISDLLFVAHREAVKVAIELGISKKFWPVAKNGVLRILEYPPGATSALHTDFDLFTLMCYRNLKEHFYRQGDQTLLDISNTISYGIQLGEILELILPYYKATPHYVKADKYNRTQYSIVYFAIPDYVAKLPTGQTVGEWLEERKARSRANAQTYEG